jgi:hypothetical protein
MLNGGARPGAGRKKGSAARIDNELRQRALADNAETPLEYMLRVMRDGRADKSRRDDMAKSAAPYLHAKLASLQPASESDGSPLEYLVRWLIARETTLALPEPIPPAPPSAE